MKAIIPLAGRGTRLRPLTHHTPKPLLRVGGRPILSYLLDDVKALGIDEMIFIVGHRSEVIREFIASEYPELRPHYTTQEVMDGTAGAVKLAQPWADDELLILFSDTLFDADLGLATRLPEGDAGILWAKEVEDYQRFGVIVTREDGSMERIVEKPSEPISKLANIGVYFIRDHELLFAGIDHVLDGGAGKGGEFYLTDAFQYMVDQGARLKTAPVTGWYDCGKVETLLDTNRHLLETTRGGVADDAQVDGAEIEGPVRIEAGAIVRGGRIGPNVTIERGAVVEDAQLSRTIVGHEARLTNVTLAASLVGARAQVSGVSGTVNLADDSVVSG
ncbi:MAG: NTP transferase domain-containing protein [Gemmatimonadetes bacterium]|nr:NTP transferase domain-containing protein [Gemmatimonadota bacterium]NNF38500.1 NTP transferase domain-containing protein [Gemmatimonadota bacterium]